MDSPFQCGGLAVKFPPVLKNRRLVIRIEKATGVQVNLRVGSDAAVDNADYFLTGGDCLELKGEDHNFGYTSGVLSTEGLDITAINILGDPLIYWRLE